MFNSRFLMAFKTLDGRRTQRHQPAPVGERSSKRLESLGARDARVLEWSRCAPYYTPGTKDRRRLLWRGLAGVAILACAQSASAQSTAPAASSGQACATANELDSVFVMVYAYRRSMRDVFVAVKTSFVQNGYSLARADIETGRVESRLRSTWPRGFDTTGLGPHRKPRFRALAKLQRRVDGMVTVDIWVEGLCSGALGGGASKSDSTVALFGEYATFQLTTAIYSRLTRLKSASSTLRDMNRPVFFGDWAS